MITQLLMNYLAQDLAAFWSIIPSLPSGLNTVIDQIVTGEAWMTSHLGDVSVVVPWSELTQLVGFFVGILAVWVVIQGIRVVLWLVNR